MTTDPQHPEGYVRDFDPATDLWSSRSEPGRIAPPGFRVVVIDELVRPNGLDWAVADPGRRCRFVIPAPDRASNRGSCKLPAVVQLYRGHLGERSHPYGYCDDPAHLFGRFWDGQRLLATILVPIPGGSA